MTKVYVVQENNYADYSDAERYGEVVFMSLDEFRPMASSLKNVEIINAIKGHLRNLKADDFLILSGNPTMIGYCFHLAMQYSAGQGINILQWDKKAGVYKPFKFEFQ